MKEKGKNAKDLLANLLKVAKDNTATTKEEKYDLIMQ